MRQRSAASANTGGTWPPLPPRDCGNRLVEGASQFEIVLWTKGRVDWHVLDDLLESGHVERVGYVPGADPAEPSAPRHNLTGDPYFTDGLRAVAIFTATTKPAFLKWA